MTLVVIDMQHVFGDPSSQWFAPRFAEILDPIDRLVPRFEPDVVFTRFVAPPAPQGAWRDYYDQWPFALVGADAPIYELVGRYAGRASIAAETFGKWDVLAGQTSDELVLAGVSTDCCVIATALAAADAGVRVRVAADACAGATDESHQQSLAVMALFAPLIELTTVDALVG